MAAALTLVAALVLLVWPSVSSAQTAATRRLTTIEGLRQFPGFFHLQNVVLRGEFADNGSTLMLRADGQEIRLILSDGLSATNGPAEIRGQMIDIGRLQPGDPRVPQDADTREPERWPRPGEELFVRVTAVTEAAPVIGMTVRALALEPWRYEGQKVTVVGNFRARNLLGDLPGAPGTSRYDFVIRGAEGAVWVTGLRPRGRGFDFDVDRRFDTDKWLEVTGLVVHERGLVTIEAGQMALATAPAVDEPPEVAEVPLPPPPPLEVVFSAPTEGESEVSAAAPVRIQFSKGIDPSSVAGAIRVGYMGTGGGTPPQFETTYDAATRSITLRFAEPLRPFSTVRVEIVDVLKGFDGAPMKPWTLTFTVGS